MVVVVGDKNCCLQCYVQNRLTLILVHFASAPCPNLLGYSLPGWVSAVPPVQESPGFRIEILELASVLSALPD